jgi:hypothetical protein
MSKSPLDYHIVVAGKDRADINCYYRGMMEFISRKEPVPCEIVQSFLGLLNDLEGFVSAELDAESEIKASAAQKRLTSLKYYEFEYIETDGTVVTFKEVLRLMIRGYLEKFRLENIKSKETVIPFFFEGLNEYFKPKLSPEKQPTLSKYKMAVIAAVLTETCWTRITRTKKAGAKELHEAAKYYLRNMG